MPPSDAPPSGLHLLYDGDCAFCQAMVDQLKQWGLVQGVEVAPMQSAQWLSPAIREQGRTQLLLFDNGLASDISEQPAIETFPAQLWGGVDAIIQLLSRKPGFNMLGRFLSWPAVNPLARHGYRLVAYNRRLISPVAPHSLPCACNPPENPAITQQFYSLLAALILLSLLAFALGASYSPAKLAAPTAVWRVFNALTIASLAGWLGAGWMLQLTLRAQARPLLPQTLISLTGGSLYCLLASLVLLSLPANHAAMPLSTGHLSTIHPSTIHLDTLLALGLGIQTLGAAPYLFRRLHRLAAPAWSPWAWLLTYLLVAFVSLQLLP